MKYLNLFLIAVLVFNLVSAYDIDILKKSISHKNVTFSDEIASTIDHTISNLNNYSFIKNDIIIDFKANVPKEMENLFDFIDDTVLSKINSKQIRVNFPVLMTFMDKENGNNIVKEVSAYENENENKTTSLEKRVDEEGFLGCMAFTGVVLVGSCTWAAVMSAGSSCVAGGLTAMFKAAYCALAYGIDW